MGNWGAWLRKSSNYPISGVIQDYSKNTQKTQTMKTTKLLFALLFMVLTALHAQAQPPKTVGSMKFFTDEGEKFTLYLNGDIKNAAPAPSVLAENVVEPMIQVRIVFEDATIPPIKKQVMRMGNDCVYLISKNKKGEYGFKVKSASGNMGGSTPPAVTSEAPTSAPSSPTHASAKLSATYSDGTISISDGRQLRVTKTKTSGGWPSPHVIMNAPTGAKVTITYDDNNEKYNTEVPFNYEVKDYNNNNSYFRLTVDEGGPDKTWYVRLQNGTAYQLTID